MFFPRWEVAGMGFMGFIDDNETEVSGQLSPA